MDGPYELQLVPKLLLKVSVWEIHHIMAIPPEEGGLNEAIDAYNSIIFSDYTL